MKEWIVEYYVERSQNETLHCITILRGRTADEVQTRLYSELRENFGKAARRSVEIFAWENIGQRVEDLYSQHVCN